MKYFKNIAFLASTMPIYLLNEKVKDWNVEIVYLQGRGIYESSKIILNENPTIKIKVLPRDRLLNTIQIFLIVLFAKLFSRKIYIFHECCWIKLDLLIKLIKPNGEYFPHVTLNGLLDATSLDISEKVRSPLFRAILVKFFSIKKEIMDGGSNDKFVLLCAIREYPRSIIRNKIIKKTLLSTSNNNLEKKAIVFVGRELVCDEVLIDMYKQILSVLRMKSYRCSIKDHPREGASLNFYFVDADITLDKKMPSEMLNLSDYKVAIGLFSTALTSFDGLSISIVNLIQQYDQVQKGVRAKHLESLYPGKVQYPESWEEFLKIIPD
jgi:hypothetical protein